MTTATTERRQGGHGHAGRSVRLRIRAASTSPSPATPASRSTPAADGHGRPRARPDDGRAPQHAVDQRPGPAGPRRHDADRHQRVGSDGCATRRDHGSGRQLHRGEAASFNLRPASRSKLDITISSSASNDGIQYFGEIRLVPQHGCDSRRCTSPWRSCPSRAGHAGQHLQPGQRSPGTARGLHRHGAEQRTYAEPPSTSPPASRPATSSIVRTTVRPTVTRGWRPRAAASTAAEVGIPALPATGRVSRLPATCRSSSFGIDAGGRSVTRTCTTSTSRSVRVRRRDVRPPSASTPTGTSSSAAGPRGQRVLPTGDARIRHGRTTSSRRSGPTSTASNCAAAATVATLTDGVDSWLVVEWHVNVVGHHDTPGLPGVDRRQRRRGHLLHLRPGGAARRTRTVSRSSSVPRASTVRPATRSVPTCCRPRTSVWSAASRCPAAASPTRCSSVVTGSATASSRRRWSRRTCSGRRSWRRPSS